MDKEEQNENNEIAATESRLLEAMSAPELASQDLDIPFEPIAEYSAYSGNELPENEPKAKMYDIIELLKTVTDPEIPINIYDMGLIYKIDLQDNGELTVDMTLTAPNCPAADFIMEDIRQKIESVDGVTSAQVNLVFEPEWDKDMMTEEAKLELGFL